MCRVKFFKNESWSFDGLSSFLGRSQGLMSDAVERHLNHLAAHQLHQRLIGIPAFQDRESTHLRARRQEHLLRGQRLPRRRSSPSAGHSHPIVRDQEHRIGNQLPVTGVSKKSADSCVCRSRAFQPDEVGGVRCEHVLLTFCRLAPIPGSVPIKRRRLAMVSNGLGAVHMGESVQYFLGTVGKIALHPFEIPEGHRRLRCTHHNRRLSCAVYTNSK